MYLSQGHLSIYMILIQYLNKNRFCEVTNGSKKCIIGTAYRSPSQNSDKSESSILSLFYESEFF